jgi:hypothetical protein
MTIACPERQDEDCEDEEERTASSTKRLLQSDQRVTDESA